ncbi:P-loop NTPase fold protein [Leuconostoc mesenteroides]|uniref:P-loop NTPase fold protein n=1 Tax=Leuconostoc mesenteroides TaxID=1245 RepID=UPI000775B7E6|nr:P-loop NTPase fold protein [Leuconostoc mesenteroides]
MENNKIENHLFEENIDTTTAEINFEQLLNQKKTFFLNGSWGSGKTEFIDRVRTRAINQRIEEKKNLVLLDLWRSDNTSIFTKAFRLLSPRWFLFFRLVIVSILCGFISMTGIIKFPDGITQILHSTTIYPSLRETLFCIVVVVPSMYFIVPSILFLAPHAKDIFQYTQGLLPYLQIILIVILVLATVGVLLSKYLGLKIDQLDYYILGKLSLKGKVLVIDDYDRLTLEQQKEGYKLFTFLKDKLPIVFLGDYERLVDSLDEKYLIKVIDKRVELPLVLHPVKIWDSYFKFLENDLDVTLPSKLQKLFISESRNLRDRIQFHSYVHQEFYTNGKKGRVQVANQLLIIYLYLFYEEDYQRLRNGSKIVYSNDALNSPIATQVNAMQDNKEEDYPLHFAKNKEKYFIFELVISASISELEAVLNDRDKLNKQFENSYAISESDFIQYVRTHQYEFRPEESQVLLDFAIYYFKKQGINSSLTRVVISENSNQIMPFKIPHGQGAFEIPEKRQGKTDEQIANIYFDEWSKLLDKKDFDYSEKIRFFRNNYLLSYSKLASKYEDLENVLKKISFFTYPEEMILIYLGSKDQWYKFDEWTQDIWDAIGDLEETNFKHLCSTLNVQSIQVHSNFTLARKTPSVENLYNPQKNKKYLEKVSKKIKEFGIEIADE